MAGRIKIDVQLCKGCGLCIGVCPKNSIVVSENTNRKGFLVVDQKGPCTGCSLCAVMCPEAAIEVYRDDNNQKDAQTPTKTDLIEEKR